MRRALLVAAAMLISPGVLRAQSGAILGRVFTAEHEDSVGRGCSVELIYRDANGERREMSRTTGDDGHFHFADLPIDTALTYVLRIEFRGRGFLSEPIRFRPGESEIDYNVLLTDQEPPEGAVPPGHPPLPGAPAMGVPVRQDPLHTILIVLWVLLVFGLLALLARRDAPRGRRDSVPAAARALARDIAGLDRSFAQGAIGEEEYRKARAALSQRLRVMTGGSTR